MTLIERLRGFLPSQADCFAAADLLESQSARIAELEALAESRLEQMNADRKAYLDLRKRIDEAPVKGYTGSCKIKGHKCIQRDSVGIVDIVTLISKEDLQK